MKIEILNFGPIKKFEFDLSKDLNVIYGKNSIGKSYAMSVVYLLLKHFLKVGDRQVSDITLHEMNKTEKKYRVVEKKVLDGKECNVTEELNNTIKDLFNKILSSDLENSFKNTFGELEKIKNFKGKAVPRIKLSISNYSIHFTIGQSIKVTKFSLDKEVIARLTNDKINYLTEDETKYFLNIKQNDPKSLTLWNMGIAALLAISLLPIRDRIDSIYFLPASRSGLYIGLSSFTPIIAELSMKRASITRPIELPALSEPIADYFLKLSGIDPGRSKNKNLLAIAHDMEKKILKGEVGFDENKKQLFYTPEGSGMNLGMSVVSSMVSELAPVVAFIKFIMGKNGNGNGKDSRENAQPFIFFEEPEAHLHPEAQVQLVEIFVRLINAEVKLIISSHSNYIFNKLSNMAIEGIIDDKRYAPIILKDDKKGSVSKLMEVDDLGVEDENFFDISDALYEERERIMDRQNKEYDAQQNQE